VSDAEIRSLNRKYRRVDRSTDVLAFALQEGEGFSNPALLGDVVVSLETAARQARRRRVSLRREVLELFIHGLLHLLGYDHVRSPARALVMRSREKEIRRGLGDGL
jgi:probable rRNA maturation factor